MRPALDKLRSVLVALVHDGHTSAHLLRSALAELEREDAHRRAFSAALPTRIAPADPARHVPVVPGAHLYRTHAGDKGASIGLTEGCDCGGPDQCDTATLPVGVECRMSAIGVCGCHHVVTTTPAATVERAVLLGIDAVDLLPVLGTADVDTARGDS